VEINNSHQDLLLLLRHLAAEINNRHHSYSAYLYQARLEVWQQCHTRERKGGVGA
jgi:hypothetical protein